ENRSDGIFEWQGILWRDLPVRFDGEVCRLIGRNCVKQKLLRVVYLYYKPNLPVSRMRLLSWIFRCKPAN
ncbi:hypothetical protein, partial [Caballeronia sp. BR00000012568055]|uniref:hypothetical protein n=1 Tax=Caballeronia sp. BR00000012568055 TaxID=2918761 RepID=UPI0023F8CF8A